MRRVEWDPAKNKGNKAKHGIDFETAQLVFDDPFFVSFIERVENGEERWHAIGMIEDVLLIVAVHAYWVEGSDEVIRMSPPAARLHMRGNCMKKLTVAKRKRLANLAKLPESGIDLSDIPEIKSLPSDAVVGKFYRPKKTSVTIRLDADVLAWLKAAGEGYQTRVNTYLRHLMRRGENAPINRRGSRG